MKEFHHTTLPNGLRIIQESSPTGVVYCGLLVDAGTRDEEASDSGMAHFCEHTTFKGTSRRRAWHIRNCLERVGGDLNAYTNKEETTYYATVQAEDFPRAVDILTDIVFHSTYPQKELKKEIEVIIDEIDSYRDSPAELIYDEFEAMLFRGHPLGRDILGNAGRLRQYTTADALRFTGRYYTPANTTFYVLGNIAFDRVVRLVDKATRDLPYKKVVKAPQPLPPYVVEQRVGKHETHQAHVLIGNRSYSRNHPQRLTLQILSNILGGPGMNSLLNVSLREKHGLVYAAESSSFSYNDTGVWAVYFGCDESDVEHCRQLVFQILESLRERPLSESRLRAAKKQMIGQMKLSCDQFESYALALGKTFARSGRHRDVDDIIRRILKITPDDVQSVAREIFDEHRLSTLIYK